MQRHAQAEPKQLNDWRAGQSVFCNYYPILSHEHVSDVIITIFITSYYYYYYYIIIIIIT